MDTSSRSVLILMKKSPWPDTLCSAHFSAQHKPQHKREDQVQEQTKAELEGTVFSKD